MRETKTKLGDPKYWLERAKEARAQAKRMRDPEERRQMLAIAESCGRLAEHIAKRRVRTLH